MRANKLKLPLILAILSVSLLATSVGAGDPTPRFTDEVTVTADADEFTYGRLVATLNYLVTNALLLGGLIAVGAIVWYGLQMTLSKGEPAKFTAARGRLIKACIGAAIIFGVYTIIATVQGAARSIGQ